jgi:hypothetical protein
MQDAFITAESLNLFIQCKIKRGVATNEQTQKNHLQPYASATTIHIQITIVNQEFQS